MVPEGLQGERTPQGRPARPSRTRWCACRRCLPSPCLSVDGKPQMPVHCCERAPELLAGSAHECMQSTGVSRASPNS